MNSYGVEKYLVFAIIGAIIGGLLGFLLRPHVPVVGQLPFSVVVSAGSDLKGLDEIVRPAAETSFGYLVLGTLMGLVGGAVLVEALRLGEPIPPFRRRRTDLEKSVTPAVERDVE